MLVLKWNKAENSKPSGSGFSRWTPLITIQISIINEKCVACNHCDSNVCNQCKALYVIKTKFCMDDFGLRRPYGRRDEADRGRGFSSRCSDRAHPTGGWSNHQPFGKAWQPFLFLFSITSLLCKHNARWWKKKQDHTVCGLAEKLGGDWGARTRDLTHVKRAL